MHKPFDTEFLLLEIYSKTYTRVKRFFVITESENNLKTPSQWTG